MRSVFETDIQAPIEKAASILANPANNQKWMRELDSYEHLSGEPGMPGSKSRLVFRNGKRKMAFTATVVKRDLPNEISLHMESPQVDIDATAHFTALSPTATHYVSDQTFTFKGFGKLIGFLAQGAIKKQQHQDLMYFKEFMER